jgi:DNA-binding NarL/FixJ family response regulator
MYHPDVLLWDLGWDLPLALDRIADLPDQAPPVVALLADDTHTGAAWAAGVRGVLRRHADPALLAAAIHAVGRGLAVLDPALAPGLFTIDPGSAAPAEALTPREMDVLRLLAEGLPNKVIAQRLEISEHTVKFHVNALLGKLNAQSRTEAVVRATRMGLILL